MIASHHAFIASVAFFMSNAQHIICSYLVHMQYEESIQKTIYEILDVWAAHTVKEQRAKAKAAGLKASGELINTLNYEVALEAGLKARAIVEVAYYGVIMDRSRIRYGKANGRFRRVISTQVIERWIKDKGLNNFKTQPSKLTREQQIKKIAWAIRSKWVRDGGYKGKRWGFRKAIKKGEPAVIEEVLAGYENQTRDMILQSLEQRQA